MSKYKQYPHKNHFVGNGRVGGIKKAPNAKRKGLIRRDEATTYSTANAVPSALRSLTSVFGMGTGGTSAL